MGLLELKPVNIRRTAFRARINPRLEKTETVMVEWRNSLNPKIEYQMRRCDGSFGEDTFKQFNLSRKDSPALKDSRFALVDLVVWF